MLYDKLATQIMKLIILRPQKPYIVYMTNIPFVILPKVYTFNYHNIFKLPSCAALALNLKVNYGDDVLDLGTGSGIQAILASDKARFVVATDINATAVRCATINKHLNHKHNITVCLGDMFEPVKGKKFDLIIWSPPNIIGRPVSVYEQSWLCGAEAQHFENFWSQVNEYLKPDGMIEFVCNTHLELILNLIDKYGFQATLLKKQSHLIKKTYYIYTVRRKISNVKEDN